MATVTTHNAPKEEELSEMYELQVEGQAVPVYRSLLCKHQGNWEPYYSFAYFDFSGEVNLTVKSSEALSEAIVRPYKPAPAVALNGSEGSFKISRPGIYIFERNGNGRKDLLLIFANPPEENVPAADDPNVVWFGPGYHQPGEIALKSNQTLYLAPGAVVAGTVMATEADNLRICGRGILMVRNMKSAEFTPSLIKLDRCQNVEVSGIIVRKESRSWSILPSGCENTRFSNVKVCGSWSGNDDGIDPSNSRNMVIEDCFFRTKDDCFALKGLTYDNGDCENITVRRCVFWSDECCAILLGDESRANYMRNITFEDCYIPYLSYEQYPKKFLMLHCGDDMVMENIRLQNIEIYGEGQETNYIEICCEVNRYNKKDFAGHIKNVILKDINLSGKPGPYNIVLQGESEQRGIDNFVFDNCLINGQPLTADYQNLTTNEFVKNCRFC